MARPGRRTGARATRSGSWLVGVTLRRSRAQWQLLLGVVAVAVLSGVLVTTLSLLVVATEQGGVRGALSATPADQTDFDVRLLNPARSLAECRAAVADAVDSVYSPAATTTAVGGALSKYLPVAAIAEAAVGPTPPTLAYFGEYDRIMEAASLTTGEWPGAASAGDPVPIAIPASAASALSLAVGSTIVVVADETDVSAVVTGTFEPDDPRDPFWASDRLATRGYDPEFPNPFTSFFNPTVVFGPLVVHEGALASAGIPVAIADLRFTPDFSSTRVDQLQPLLDRLATADVDVLYDANAVAGSVFIDTDAADAVSAVASGLTVTRSTVVVVSLLLVVLAVAAMAQLARLYSDARAGERQLMRARGASRRDVVALATVEAVAIAAVTAAAVPPLASLAYRLLAAQGPMVAAGMPADAGLPPATWLIAAGIALVFVLVLLSPLARDDVSFAEGLQAAGRQRLGSGIARSGIDVAIVLLAAVAYWQLRSYRTPVQDSATLAVDPVLVAGPAVVLVATALVCARLIPAASRLLERIGSGARGATVALASWEIGRRPQRATAAVLLLSLTLAVGTFGLSFLDTWKQSQLDQAAFAVGAPVRVPGVEPPPAADGAAEPVMRRPIVGALGADPETGASRAALLALTPGARDLLAHNRLGELGGDTVVDALDGRADAATGIELPAGTSALAATVRFGDPEDPLDEVSADLSAVVEYGDGELQLLPLGRVSADGTDHDVSGELTRPAPPEGVRFAGFTVRLVDTLGSEAEGEHGTGAADVLLAGLGAVVPADGDGSEPSVVALAVPADAEWFGSAAQPSSTPILTDDVPAGRQLRLGIVVPLDLRSTVVSFASTGWLPGLAVPAVVSGALTDRLEAGSGTDVEVSTGGVPTIVRVVATAPLVPGAASTSDLAGPAPALGGAPADLVVVDTTLLARSLIEAGADGPFVDEWWVDVPAGEADSYLDALPPGTAAVGGGQLGERLQEAPLRVATQAALWVAIAASTLLAAIGFGVHSAAGLRSRRLELAQLRAIGYSRRRLVGLVGIESLLLCVLGALFGITIGLMLAWLVGPLVAVSPTGVPTVPSVVVEVPLPAIALLLVGLVAVLAVVVLMVARLQRFTEPAHLLREGAQP
jgi:hypothetical protein